MNAILNQKHVERAVFRFGLFERLNDRSIEVHRQGVLFSGQFAAKDAKPRQNLFVASSKHFWTRHIIVWGRFEEREASLRKLFPDRFHEGTIAILIVFENIRIKRAIKSVVHPQHDCDDGRFVIEYVAMQPQIDRSILAAADLVATHSGREK